jgi:hypothetical protein
MSPPKAIMNKLRAGIEEAEEELQYSMRASCEQRAVRDAQVLQEQVANAQRDHFILQDRNQEVLIINSMLRSELAYVRRENEAYKEQLKLLGQECQITSVESDVTLAELADTALAS